MDNRGKMESDGDDMYESYFADDFPYIDFFYSSIGVQWGRDLLFFFDNPHPTQIAVVENSETKNFDIDGNTFEYLVDEDSSQVKLKIVKTQPNQRVVVYAPITKNETDYVLKASDMMDYPYATMEEKVKAIRVKVFTYEIVDGEIEQVDDEVYYTEVVDSLGIVKTIENPLISTLAQAELVAKWAKGYYQKNLTYNYEYRGEPALQADDMIFAESKYAKINALDVQTAKISFNGAFRGEIDARPTLEVEN